MSKILDAEDILAYARDCIECASSAATHIFGKEGDPITTVIDIAGEKIDAARALLADSRETGDASSPLKAAPREDGGREEETLQ
jgi:hypothetical protein